LQLYSEWRLIDLNICARKNHGDDRQMMAKLRIERRWIMVLILLLLTGCSGGSKVLDENIALATQKLQRLKATLDSDQLRNAQLIRQYARIVAEERPELSPITRQLAKDATTAGQPFQWLTGRLADVKKLKAQYGDPNKLLDEVYSIIEAADSRNFDNALADSVNVLADMSQGKLARIGTIAKDQESAFNDTKNLGAGAQLVGNPTYGHWSSSGGSSFWEWYGMYAMFSNLVGGRHVYYSTWDRHRPYSYYQDRGINRYGSPFIRDKWGRHYGSTYQKSAGSSTTRGFGSRSRRASSFSRGAGVSRKPRPTAAHLSRPMTGTLRRSSRYSSRGIFGGK